MKPDAVAQPAQPTPLLRAYGKLSMPQSTTVVALRHAPFARSSFVRLHVAPLWQRAVRAAALVGEVWNEARALERQMTPRRFID